MMESPKTFKTLTGDDGAGASNGSVLKKDESFDGECHSSKLDDVASNVNSCVGAHTVVGVVKEEGYLARSAEIGNNCLDMGIEGETGFENAGGEMKKDAVFFDNLDDVPVQQVDLGEGTIKFGGDAIDIKVDKLVHEEQPLLLKEDIAVGVSSNALVEKQNLVDNFSVGDLVWCMAKNNIWWPALICDPLDAPKHSMKSRDPSKLLVQHFGSKTMAWCPLSRLKHFLESFDEMSRQGKSKSFLGSIEKAAEEVGRRVKLEMTCSCISREMRARLIGRSKEDFKPWYVSNETAALQFDPTTFLNRVKSLARMSYVPDIVETVATRCKISAYYSYIGHSQMYMWHLREADGPNEDATPVTAKVGTVFPSENMEEDTDSGTDKSHHQSLDLPMLEESPELWTDGAAEMGFESRERKKSKYLSFPFIDPSATKAFREKDSSVAFGKRGSSSSKRLLGMSARKFSSTASYDDLKNLKVSSGQLLTELRDTSRGRFYLNGNTILNSTFEFFCEFRHFAFSDGDNASNWYNDGRASEKEGLEVVVAIASPLSEIKPAKKRKKSVKFKLEASNDELQVNDVHSKAKSPVANAETKIRKRKESPVANNQTKKTDGVPDLNVNGFSPNPPECEGNPLGDSSDEGEIPEADSQLKKKKSEQPSAASEPEHELENGIINAKPISLVADLFVDSDSLAGLMEANVERHFGDSPASTSPSLPENVKSPELATGPEHMDLLPVDIKSNKKVENPDLAETSLGLPDLNGNGLEPSSSVTCTMANMIPASHPVVGGQELTISAITNNLEMMTKMLEQSGSTLSPEMKAKLENDVQSLLKKIKDMSGSSL